MSKQYKISFNIQGDMLADNIKLNKQNLKKTIYNILDCNKAQSYYGDRNIDTAITNLKLFNIAGENSKVV